MQRKVPAAMRCDFAEEAMRIGRVLIIGTAVALGTALTTPAGVAMGKPVRPPDLKYKSFDFPQAQYTNVTGINKKGVIAGYFGDASGQHGFTYGPKKEAVTIDVPDSNRLVVTSINDPGTATGAYWKGTTEYGFIRDATGEFTTLDKWEGVPAPEGHEQGTFASQINSSGVVVGYYFTTDLVGALCPTANSDFTIPCPSTMYHGFVWTPWTGFTSYDNPEAGADAAGYPSMGTKLLGLNNSGDMVGSYTYLGPWSIDPRQIVGVTPGFVISGVTVTPAVTLPATFTKILDPDLTTSWCCQTTPSAINDEGIVVGNAVNGCAPAYFVFTWTAAGYNRVDGNPGHGPGSSNTATTLSSINNDGVVGGSWRTSTPTPYGPVYGPEHGLTATLR
jgi:hypothetical protein